MLLLLLPAALAFGPPGAVPRHPPRPPALPTAGAGPDDWDVTHYDIDVRIDPEARTVEGVVRLDAQAVGDRPDTLVLHADGPTLLSVEVDGNPVSWSQEGDEVAIPTAAAGDTITVQVAYEVAGDDASGLYLGLDWGQPIVSFHEPEGARHWLVVRDEPHDKATLTWRTTMPDDWQVVQNGVVTSQESADGWTTTVSELDLPLPPYLMVLHAGDLVSWRDDSGPVPVELWAAPELLDAAVADLGETGEIIARFEGLWDPYPWPLYRNVVVPFGGGMEHTTATTFGEELLGGGWAGIVNAHEIAHHWWGDYVTCATWDEIWLNEGFASHAEVRYYEAALGEEGRRSYFEYQRDSYLEWKGYEGVFSLYDPNYMWGGTVYDKGSLVLDMLRSLVGEAAFDATLRRYAEDNAHGAVTTADLQAAFEAETGQEWGWYFDQWVFQADDPTYRVGLHLVALDDGGWQVDLFARQDNDAGTWTMPLSWQLRLADGSVIDESFWVDEAGASLSLCLDQPVEQATLDPEVRLLHGGITRDDGAFAALPVTCGAAATAAPGGFTGGAGCAAAGAGGALLPALLALLGRRRRRLSCRC